MALEGKVNSISPDKGIYSKDVFFIIIIVLKYIVGTYWNRFADAISMTTHKIFFCVQNSQNYPSLSHPLVPYLDLLS